MKEFSITRESAVLVGKRFAYEMRLPETRVLAATESWFDADQNQKARDANALREYLNVRFA